MIRMTREKKTETVNAVCEAIEILRARLSDLASLDGRSIASLRESSKLLDIYVKYIAGRTQQRNLKGKERYERVWRHSAFLSTRLGVPTEKIAEMFLIYLEDYINYLPR